MGLFQKISKGLKKTRESMAGAIDDMLYGKVEIDDTFFDDSEEVLVMGDVGVYTAQEIAPLQYVQIAPRCNVGHTEMRSNIGDPHDFILTKHF